jgi:hypothetical protein
MAGATSALLRLMSASEPESEMAFQVRHSLVVCQKRATSSRRLWLRIQRKAITTARTSEIAAVRLRTRSFNCGEFTARAGWSCCVFARLAFDGGVLVSRSFMHWPAGFSFAVAGGAHPTFAVWLKGWNFPLRMSIY